MRKAFIAVIGLASFWLSVEMANAERPRGPNCIAGYTECKNKANGSQPAINACLKTFNQCVADNKDQHYNPYGYPNRIGTSPAVLYSVPSVSVGKASAASGAKTGIVATATVKSGSVGARTINPGAAATTTINAPALSAPAKPSTAISNGMLGQPPGGQFGRGNLRVQ